MRNAVANIPAETRGGTAEPITGTLASYVDRVVKQQGLTEQLSQMSPAGADELRMRYSAVDFNRLVSFIAEVNARGLQIRDIRVSASDVPGVVDCSLVLIRS